MYGVGLRRWTAVVGCIVRCVVLMVWKDNDSPNTYNIHIGFPTVYLFEPSSFHSDENDSCSSWHHGRDLTWSIRFIRSVLLHVPPSKLGNLVPRRAGSSAFSPRWDSICQCSIGNFPHRKERVPDDVSLDMYVFLRDT